MRKIIVLFVALLSACQMMASPTCLADQKYRLNTSNTDPVLMTAHKTFNAYGMDTHAGETATLNYNYSTEMLALSASGQDRRERMFLEMSLSTPDKGVISTTVYHDRLVNQNQTLADEAEVELIKHELALRAIQNIMRKLSNA